MNRPCHKANLYNLTERESLKVKEFPEVELAEAKTLRLLKSMSSNDEFKVVKNSGKSCWCKSSGKLRGDITLLQKGNYFETSTKNSLKSKTHQKAKNQSEILELLH